MDERNKECASSEDIVALVEKLYLMSLIFWYKCFIFEKKEIIAFIRLHILPISILARVEKARSKKALTNTFIVNRDF